MTTQEFYKIFKKDKQEAFNEYLKMPLQERKDFVLIMITQGVRTCRKYLRLKHKRDRGNIPVTISKNLEEKVIFFMDFFEAVQQFLMGEDFIKNEYFGEEYWQELQELCVREKETSNNALL